MVGVCVSAGADAAADDRGHQCRKPGRKAAVRRPALQLQQVGQAGPEHNRSSHCQGIVQNKQ